MKLKKLKNLKQFKILFCALLALLIGVNMQAQSTMGTDFWLTFSNNLGRNYTDANTVRLQVRIVALRATKATLSFTANTGLNTVLDIPAGGMNTYELTQAQTNAVYVGASTTGTSNQTIHITATDSVSVYAINLSRYTTDATNVLPVDNLGMDYYQISYRHDTSTFPDGYCVVATENGTAIYENYENSSSVPVQTLDSGQVYKRYSGVSDGGDMTGRHITSSKPVAYFATCVGVTIGGSQSDCLFQQLPPTDQWGEHFIVPGTTQNDGRVRVVAMQDGTTISQTGAVSLISGSYTCNAGQWLELSIDGNGCYISSNKPVGVCAFLTTGTTGGSPVGDPSEAWIAPIEQRERNILIAPFMPSGSSILSAHYAVIMTETATKDRTTVSINGAAPVNASGSITWVDNVGGSGYSFGRYTLANNTYMFDNPSGLTVGGYGLGTDESYYYMAGSAARDLQSTYTVNTIDYTSVNGTSLCTNAIAIQAAFTGWTPEATTIKWWLNGSEFTAYSGDPFSWSTTLADGIYTLEMRTPSGAGTKSQATYFAVGEGAVIWTPAANTAGTDAEKQEWDNAENWTPKIVPSACINVYIPGNSSHYPQLTAAAECRNIYFMQGAELGRPDLLTYSQARVHYNFDLLQSTQNKETNPALLQNLVLAGEETEDRLTFSASTSTPLSRERWYALSAPLRNVVSGDFSYGGFPLTFLMKFGPIIKDNVNYNTGTWTTPYTSFTETIGATEGFGFYMYGYDSGGNADRNLGCTEYGLYSTPLNDMTYLPAIRSGHAYGIQKSNGILELPFYADSLNMEAHRTQVYTPATAQSQFYYISDDVTAGLFNTLTGNSATVTREDNDGNYRFIAEAYNAGTWTFQNSIDHSVAGLSSGNEFLVGNPYMSSIDMVEFCKDNAAAIEPAFKIWDGTTFNSYSVDISGGTVTPVTPAAPGTGDRYVAPLQGFFLTYKSGKVTFDVTKISTVRPYGTASNLRSSRAEAENNILRIKAENEAAASYMLIAYKQGADNDFLRGEDVRKLFSPYGYVPEIYALAGETPVDIDFINHNGEITVPLGIKTKQLGNTTFTFSGMDHYSQASKIIFEDRLLNKEIDLTNQTGFTYPFTNQTEGIQNGRFFLRFATLPTAIAKVEDMDTKVFRDASGIHITTGGKMDQIIFYDLQGKKIYETGYIGTGYYTVPAKLLHGIAKVITAQGVKNIKF